MATRILGQSPDPRAPLPPHDVKIERLNWCDFCCGTKAALIAAGIAADGQFHGDPGRGSTS